MYFFFEIGNSRIPISYTMLLAIEGDKRQGNLEEFLRQTMPGLPEHSYYAPCKKSSQ